MKNFLLSWPPPKAESLLILSSETRSSLRHKTQLTNRPIHRMVSPHYSFKYLNWILPTSLGSSPALLCLRRVIIYILETHTHSHTYCDVQKQKHPGKAIYPLFLKNPKSTQHHAEEEMSKPAAVVSNPLTKSPTPVSSLWWSATALCLS